MDNRYLQQTSLMIRILPLIHKMKVFALHGGTAINLFYHDMSRLSVDIDLTYIPIKDRKSDLVNIKHALLELAYSIKSSIPNIKLTDPNYSESEFKLFCFLNNAQIKIEVNTINRGLFEQPELKTLCLAAQERFKLFTEMSLVSKAQLYGGKFVAALDRQHPRDIYDTMQFLKTNQLSPEIMIGFLFCLMSSNRPFHELLYPSLLNQEDALHSQFKGMTNIDFDYSMFQKERKSLIETIHIALTDEHKYFIKSFVSNKPDWLYGDWSRFPGIAWKSSNLKALQETNRKKFQEQIEKLEF